MKAGFGASLNSKIPSQEADSTMRFLPTLPHPR